MPKGPLYPHVPKGNSSEVQKIRLHRLLCDQIDEALHEAVGKAFKIETERIQTYGKSDPIAVKVEYLTRALRAQRGEIADIATMLVDELAKRSHQGKL